MSVPVNLDALIPREDFDVAPDPDKNQSLFVQTIQIRDLELGTFFYAVLRKPDFQRETSDWDPKKISEFVNSFLNGDLIPAIILWNSGKYNFVIDGAHRLSALIAWVHDDYGDKENSFKFFEGRIPVEQSEVAEKARELINTTIGSYKDYKMAVLYPDRFDKLVVESAMRLGTLGLQLQWVKGDAEKAENSFFKINQQATPIDPTELKLLKARKQSNALAARAIIRSGTGHKYWSKFNSENQNLIEEIAQEIHAILFMPSLNTPIKTLDLPVAGRGYAGQSLQLIFELINIINNVKGNIPDDVDGEQTVVFLREARKIIYRISGNHPSSLGLHPVVYFYSPSGRYQPVAFLAIIRLLQEFEAKNYYRFFTDCREKFEDFWLKYKNFASQISYRYGSGAKSYDTLYELFKSVVENIGSGKTEEEILHQLRIGKFSFLRHNVIDNSITSKEFSSEIKSAAFIREALANAVTCKICGGRLHMKSVSIDHITRKSQGGLGEIDNAQLTHPYCNTTYKH